MSDGLADVETWFTYWATIGTEEADGEEREAARLLKREYDRRGVELSASRPVLEAARAYVTTCLCNGGVPELAHTISEAFAVLSSAVQNAEGAKP